MIIWTLMTRCGLSFLLAWCVIKLHGINGKNLLVLCGFGRYNFFMVDN